MTRLLNDLRGPKRIALMAGCGALGGAVFSVIATGELAGVLVGVPLGMISAMAADIAASKDEERPVTRYRNPREFKWRWRVFLFSPLWGGGLGFLAFYLMGHGNIVWGLIGIPMGLLWSLWLSRAFWRFGGPTDPKWKDRG